MGHLKVGVRKLVLPRYVRNNLRNWHNRSRIRAIMPIVSKAKSLVVRAIVVLPATNNVGRPRQAALRTAELTFVPRMSSQQIGLTCVINNGGGL